MGSAGLYIRRFARKANRYNNVRGAVIRLFCGEPRGAIRSDQRGGKRGTARQKTARIPAWFLGRDGRDNWDLPGRGASQGCEGVPRRRRLRWRISPELPSRQGKTQSPGRIVRGVQCPARRLWL